MAFFLKNGIILLSILVSVQVAVSQIPSNPFCGYTKERNTVYVDLVCVNE